ncbi:CMGC/MAPK/P38 protein kinase [Sphaeroforma arctica JP610]|uniref:mitogen-activated protein kinase n=1 Tax=Sphaeroforma arctica JP610 TaxID=667725 RepID=A0A0L0FSR2_9EUKA|nr:CMGC/MAPK/P38 protein kinase [Sphaeroforma arctica JP610]KNC79724.1 CMGC/MAPK/P38 protein kinase [Sphaeroforma arctica JP610]|eukprot:XP_014153626.1 CMGC/MAPK/P38 protein kinase [Sphaeroforma arctica JP610]
MELLDADLRRVIYTQDLTEEHTKFFIYQILRGLKYVHSADIVHRDLKPGNIAVNEDCGVKILDFGLARQSDPEMTGYVATRYKHYRAPEIMLNWRRYDKGVDIWSVGCIMAEIINKKTLFNADDYVTHITTICEVVGTPDEDTIASIGSSDAQQFIRDLPKHPPKGFDKICPGASPEAVDFLSRCLVFDGKRRMNVLEALEHPFVARFHDPGNEPILQSKFDFSKYEEKDYTIEEWKRMS